MARAQPSADDADHGRVLERLEGRSCPHCDGTLERATYKGNRAIVCSGCGTPRAQVWS
ncbi:HVO_A0556 family zinc finger protein [Natrarchaeobaculum aegyptiacum]|uniref:HVO_A0556 family zinc finger protein n=1 Tax=Natrarchaeobaculum aegyptiacum TaxID=745377 RepID=UPI001642C473|nr:HVO_A0556 family zinc finger protein [Natrarchaeobaculum aegyptiacum]